jgi:hypothetical protein
MNNVPPQPPQNLEAERAVLCAVLLDNDVLREVAPILRPGDFYKDAHGQIYDAIYGIWIGGNPVDAVTLADDLTRNGRYEQIGGDALLVEIGRSVPHAANARFHARIVREKSIARQLILAGTDLIRDGYSNMFSVEQMLDIAEQKVLGILGFDPDPPYELVNLATCDYGLYLKTEHWKRARSEAIERCGNRCMVCNSADRLDVHHRTYERRGREEPADLIVLCRGCHTLFHDNGKISRTPA